MLRTVGGGRPPTGRSDWPPIAVQGLKYGYPDWMAGQPLTNWSAAPVLFDLHQDCGETIPRTPCPWNGRWPAHFLGVGDSSWHSGCMPAAEYKSVVARLVSLYHEHVSAASPFIPPAHFSTVEKRSFAG